MVEESRKVEKKLSVPKHEEKQALHPGKEKTDIKKVIEKMKKESINKQNRFLTKIPEDKANKIRQGIAGIKIKKSHKTEDEIIAEKIEKGKLG